MPNYCGMVYVPRTGRSMKLLGERLIELGFADNLQQYIQSAFGRPVNETQRKIPYISYEDLPSAVKLAGFENLIDLYNEAGIDATVPAGFVNLYHEADTWTDADINKLTELILSGEFCEKWWTEWASPSEKLRGIVQRHFPLRGRHEIDYGAATKEGRRAYSHPFNAISLDAIPDVAERLDVSLRWMLGLKDDAMIYSDRAAVENLYDAMMLLPAERREIVDMILRGGESHG